MLTAGRNGLIGGFGLPNAVLESHKGDSRRLNAVAL